MLATLIQTIANGNTSHAAKRVRRAMIDFAIAGIALAIGLGFLIAAGFMVAMKEFGAIYAALGFGVGFIAIAGAALIVHRILSGMAARRRAEEARATQLKTLAGATAFAVLPALLKGRGGFMEIVTPILAMAAYAIYKENAASAQADENAED